MTTFMKRLAGASMLLAFAASGVWASTADGIKALKKSMDAGEVGGTALMGISRPVVKAHGSSDAYAIKNAIRQARDFAASGLIDDITENIEHMRLPARQEEKI